MKRRISIIALLLLALMLSSCGNGLVFNEKPRIQFAIDNADLLQKCVEIICSKYCPKEWNSVLIFSENGRLYMCEYTTHREDSKIEINSNDLTELFQLQIVTNIRIWTSGDSIKSIEFLIESIGMGSSSYSEIAYIPADSIEDSSFYTEKLHFIEFREGYKGEIAGSDNYLYYVQIMPCYFYIEYGD